MQSHLLPIPKFGCQLYPSRLGLLPGEFAFDVQSATYPVLTFISSTKQTVSKVDKPPQEHMMKYSDLTLFGCRDWLHPLFYVGGGNIMHLTESLSKHLIGVPVVHELAAGVATEYFNKISKSKALALVIWTGSN